MSPSWLPLPSLLPSNLQKRLLSYALTHVLGTFLEPQSFSVENLELQLLNGSVSLRNLQLNAAKINSLLKLPGIEIIEGRVGEVSLQIPVRDVLSGKISVNINGIQVLVRPCSETGQLPFKKRLIPDKPSSSVPDLTPDSLAQSFLESSIHDPTDSVLLDTLSHSIPAPEELGLGPAEGEGMFATILAGFVDALKARLAIELEDLAIHVQHPRSGSFILSLARISFLPHEEKLSEKVLSMGGIEAYLRHEDEDIAASASSLSTVTSPSPTHHRSLSLEDHGLSESMMFSPHEAESLYMSAYSQPAGQSTHMSAASLHPELPSPVESPFEEPILSSSVDKGFRFFYFEEDLVFHVTTSESTDPSVPNKTRLAPVLQSAIPAAHLFLNPQVNLLPSISLISTILSLSPASASEPPQTVEENAGDTGGIDFSWLGGVVVHFGSDSDQTIARFADWKFTKRIGEENLSISIGQVEILSSTGTKILSLEKSRLLNVVLLPDLVQVSVPGINLHVDIGGVGTLQPLVKAMKQAWQESLQQVQHSTSETAVEDADDEDWNENLIVEKASPSTSNGRPIEIDIKKISVQLSTDDGTIQFSINEIHTQVHPSNSNTIEFGNATVSIPTIAEPLLSIIKTKSNKPIVDFVTTEQSPRPGFLVNGAQEILDDFLVGDASRSDDAWGMIRADASNNSKSFIKIKFPRIEIQVTSSKDIDAVKKVVSRIQNTLLLFVEESAQEERDDEEVDFVVEFALEEGRLGVRLDDSEVFDGQWEGVEGTFVSGVAGGEIVGVVDVTKLQIDVNSPLSPRKVLHESIQRVHLFNTPLMLGKRFKPIYRITIRAFP